MEKDPLDDASVILLRLPTDGRTSDETKMVEYILDKIEVYII